MVTAASAGVGVTVDSILPNLRVILAAVVCADHMLSGKHSDGGDLIT